MKLTQYSDLCLRMLMYLALRYENTVTIEEVSARFAVSKNHMVKVSHQLTKAGLIESTRGRYGGVRLSRPPESISVEDALYATEDNFQLVQCFGANDLCVITDACKLSGTLERALKAFFSVLRQVSLADLVKNGKAFEKTLLPFPATKIINYYPRSSSTEKGKAK